MKLLLLKTEDESQWGSCKVISPNLHALYQNLGDGFQVEWFEIPQDLVRGELSAKFSYMERLVQKLAEFRPERLIFVDHLPVPSRIVAHLSLHINLKKLPPLIFHIYGDFTYFSNDWLFLNSELLSHKMEFIVASAAQKKLVEEFLDTKVGVSQLCFPVNDNDYYFDALVRTAARKELGLKEEDFVLLYSGRISLQKNVDILLQEYFKLKKEVKGDLYLWIVGAFDDVGAEFMGYSTFHGHMFTKIQNLLNGYSDEERKLLKFWGQKSKNDLLKLKNAADFFISLSVYHDEDYGMSPAEALATGLPSMLTDWGGYSSFVSPQKEWVCSLVPVAITDFGLELETGVLRKTVIKAIEEKELDQSQRKNYSQSFHKHFSINANKSKLGQILKKPMHPFGGFNWLLQQYASALNMNWSKSKLNKFLNPDHKGFYYNIYKNYISMPQEKLNDKK